MYETLLAVGKDKPKVTEGDDYVEVSVFRNIITKEASRVFDYISDHYKLNRRALIALGIILKEKTITSLDLTKELQLLSGERLRSYMDALVNERIVLAYGKGKGIKYTINPDFVADSKLQFTTTLKTMEPYRLKALVCEDLKFHPDSSLSEIASRLPDVDYSELEKTVRLMAKEGMIKPIGGRKFRRYSLP
jgi:ATP-dependent DNA helicase RecG